MLRIHFTPDDLTRIRVASTPDPLWETAFSLHRLQTTQGRWAYADWHRGTLAALTGTRLGAAVRGLLIPVLPRAPLPDIIPQCSGFQAGGEASHDAATRSVAVSFRRSRTLLATVTGRSRGQWPDFLTGPRARTGWRRGRAPSGTPSSHAEEVRALRAALVPALRRAEKTYGLRLAFPAP
ncbi:hypothetical protein ABK046_06440 [Streptomyces caeruleatus]